MEYLPLKFTANGTWPVLLTLSPDTAHVPFICKRHGEVLLSHAAFLRSVFERTNGFLNSKVLMDGSINYSAD